MIDTPDDTPRPAPLPQDDDVLPARLRAQRLAQHLTTAELAQRTGLAADVIARLECGQQRLTIGLIDTLTRGLGVRVQELLGTEDPDAVRRHLDRYLSPQARKATAALLRDLQRLHLSPQARLVLAARLRQAGRAAGDGASLDDLLRFFRPLYP